MTHALTPPDWTSHARCAQPDVDSDLWYPIDGQHRQVARAVKLCKTECPVTAACLAYALDIESGDDPSWRKTPGIHGVWGGTTAEERRGARRRQRLRKGGAA